MNNDMVDCREALIRGYKEDEVWCIGTLEDIEGDVYRATGTIYIWEERISSCLPIPQLWRIPHKKLESYEKSDYNVIWGRRLKYSPSLEEDFSGDPILRLNNQIAEEIATVVTHGHASWAFRTIGDHNRCLDGLAPVVPLIDVNFGSDYTPLYGSSGSSLSDIIVPIAFTPHMNTSFISMYWGKFNQNDTIKIATEAFTICAVLDIIFFTQTGMMHGDLSPTNVLIIPKPCVFNINCNGKTLRMWLPFTPSIIDFDQTLYVDNIPHEEVIKNSLIHLQTLFVRQMKHIGVSIYSHGIKDCISNNSIIKAIMACCAASKDKCIEEALSCLLERPFDNIFFVYHDNIRKGIIKSVDSKFKDGIVFNIDTTWEKFSREAYVETPEGYSLCKYLHEALKNNYDKYLSSFANGVDFDFEPCERRKETKKRRIVDVMPVFVRVAKNVPIRDRCNYLKATLDTRNLETIFKFLWNISDDHPTSYYLQSAYKSLEVFYEPESPSGGGGGLSI